MNKITLLFFAFLFSISSYSQFFEDFENTTGPSPTPSTTWALPTSAAYGNWAVFDNGIGTANRWTVNATSYAGLQAAYINRDQNGAAGATSEDYLATPLLTVPLNGQLRFFSRTFTSGLQGTTYQVRVAPATANQNDPSAYTLLLQQYNEDQLTFDDVTSIQNAFNVYSEHVINMPSSLYGQQVYISFVKVFTQPTTAISGDRWLLDNVNLVEQCFPPTSNPTTAFSTSANLSWTGQGSSFEIEYGIQGFLPTGVANATSTTNTVSINGLTPQQNYCYYVRAVCSVNNTSTWAGPFCFTTSPAPPVCGGTFVDSGGTGNYPNNANETYPVTPPAGQVVTVTFTTFNTETGADTLSIYSGTTLIGTYSGTTLPPAITSTINTSNPNGQLIFVFTSNGTVTSSGWTANITCGTPPSCTAPNALTTINVTSDSLTLNFSETNQVPATSWQVYMVPCGSPAPTASTTPTATIASTSYAVTGLAANTCYCFYVRAVCSATDSSAWSLSTCVTTTIAPIGCGGNYVDSGGPNGQYQNNENIPTLITAPAGQLVTLTFTSFNTEQGFDELTIYDGSNANVGTPIIGVFDGTALPPVITSSGNSLYCVFTSDGSVVRDGFIANISCNPPPTCVRPINVVATATSQTEVSVSWTQPQNPDGTTASAWQIIAVDCGNPAPSFATQGISANTNTGFVVTGLTSNHCYDFYVRAICSATDQSAWSVLGSATTLAPPPPSCVNTTPASDTCAQPPIICDFNGYCGNTSASYTPTNWNELEAATTIGFDNDSYLTFTAGGTSISFNVWVTSSVTGDGIQILVFSAATCGSGPVDVLYEWNPGSVPTGPFNITVNNLIPGNTYYVLIDGFAGDNCDFVIGADDNSGIICPTCPKPISLTTQNISTSTVDFSWINNTGVTSTNWEYIALPCGSPAPTAATVGTLTTSNSITISGLTPSTCYDLYVRVICDATDTSLWSGPSTITTLATCPKPTLLNPITTLSTSITVGFTNNSSATTFEYVALPCGSAAPTSTTIGTQFTGNQANITGLTPDTCYDIYIRAICSPTDSSDWSLPLSQTTSSVPPVCGGTFTDSGGVSSEYSVSEDIITTICATSGSQDLVTVTFTSFNTEPNFDGLYVYDGSNVSSPQIASTNGPGFGPLTAAGAFWGLTIPGPFISSVPGGCLTFRFRSDGSITRPGWTSNVTCAPAPTCAKPINLTVTASSTSATLNWVQPTNPDGSIPTQWQVFIQPAGSGIPSGTGIIVNTNPVYIATGLNPQTNYEYWVTAICSSTDSSPIAGPKPFYTTVSCGDSQPFCGEDGLTYPNTTGVPSYGSIGCLLTTPNPAWYYMQVNQNGALNFTITQGNNAPLYDNQDVDFICWGPFDATTYPNACSNLYDFPDGNTGFPTNVVACSYSALPIENFVIPNAIAGQYYIVLITNFSNQAGTVTFNQTNLNQSGAGGTNCELVCSVELGSDVVLCDQTNYTINSTNENATSYSWYLGTTLLVGEIGSSLIVTQSGVYKCIIVCGQNTSEDTVQVTFNSLVEPTFNSILNICQNTTPPTLPTTSLNLFSGSWNPSTIDTTTAGTFMYNFTPNAGQCASIKNIAVTIIPTVIPQFASVADLCQNATAPTLETTDQNGITGTWSPANIDTSIVGTTPYLFTPTAGQNCVSTYTLNVTITNEVTPTFTQIQPICQFTTAPILPTTSPNGVAGTWLPDTIDTSVFGTVTYTFTPDTSLSACAVPVTMDITVNEQVAPTFNIATIYCQNDAAQALSIMSVNLVSGTWLPSAIDTSILGQTTYTFTPNTSECASPYSVNVFVNTPITPTFAIASTLCENAVPPTLSTTSDNVIGGTWNPAVIDTTILGTTQYTFTPDSGFCANQYVLNVTVQDQITPTFNAITNICQFSTAPSLQNPSNELIVGTWSPATIDTSVAGTFTFTFNPDLNLNPCAVSTTFNVTVDPIVTPTFNVIADICQNGLAPSLPSMSVEGISGTWNPAIISTANVGTINYVFTPTTGICATTGNVSVTILVPTQPTFNAIGAICINTTAPSLQNPSNEGISGTWFPAIIDTSVLGLQTFTFTPTSGLCATTSTFSVAIISPPQAIFDAIAPICQNTTAPILPTTSLNGIQGTWFPATIDTSVFGSVTYSFTPNIGQCGTGNTLTVVVNEKPVLTPVSNVSSCSSYTLPALTVGNYYSQPNGVSPIESSTITSSQTVYVYAANSNQPSCTSEEMFIVTISDLPIFAINGNCDGLIYVLSVVPSNFELANAQYSWTNSLGQVVGTNATLTVSTPDNYSCSVTINSCSDIESYSANDIACKVPKGISPNSDGLNDSFDLTGFNVKKLSIFNRYGTVVYSKTDYTNQWVGKSDKGNELPDGTYYYVIERNGIQDATGWVYINRETK